MVDAAFSLLATGMGVVFLFLVTLYGSIVALSILLGADVILTPPGFTTDEEAAAAAAAVQTHLRRRQQ